MERADEVMTRATSLSCSELDVGAVSADIFKTGYLDIILPDMKTRTVNGASFKDVGVIPKLFVLIPATTEMIKPSSECVDWFLSVMERGDKSVTIALEKELFVDAVVVARAGVSNRAYGKHPVYSVTSKEDGVVIARFCMEWAASSLTMYEILKESPDAFAIHSAAFATRLDRLVCDVSQVSVPSYADNLVLVPFISADHLEHAIIDAIQEHGSFTEG
jgi:hypothetical protein